LETGIPIQLTFTDGRALQAIRADPDLFDISAKIAIGDKGVKYLVKRKQLAIDEVGNVTHWRVSQAGGDIVGPLACVLRSFTRCRWSPGSGR